MLDAYTDYELLAFFPDQFTTDPDRERYPLLKLKYLTRVFDMIAQVPDPVLFYRIIIVDHELELTYSINHLDYTARFKIDKPAAVVKKMDWHITKSVRRYKSRMLKLALRPVTSSSSC